MKIVKIENRTENEKSSKLKISQKLKNRQY